MGVDFDFYCKIRKKKSKQIYKTVGWSGDKLAVCSACNQSPWSGEAFVKSHKPIVKTKGAK